MSLLHSPEGGRALAAAMAEPDSQSLAAATRLRKDFPAELAAQALAQAALRRRGRTKFGEQADHLFFTADALEQATRPAVAAWRAQRLVAEGITRVVDLGCGIGTDALACAEAGLAVQAVELDPTTAEHARANLALAGVAPESVLTGDAVALADELLGGSDASTAVFLDPARRTERGRSWRIEALTPPWSFVLAMLDAPHSTVVKLGPGVPKNLLPEGVEALWLAEGHDVVECSLWRTPGSRPVQGAVLLPSGQRLDADPHAPAPEVGPVGRYLAEPHGAAIRAGVAEQAAPGWWRLDAHVAYLSGDEPLDSPWLTCFEVLEVLDAHPRSLRAWVREHQVGTLEIKKRSVDVDPAELRQSLRPKGPNSATLVLAHTVEGARALVVRRL